MILPVVPLAFFCRGRAFLVVRMGGKRGQATIHFITKKEKLQSTLISKHLFEKFPVDLLMLQTNQSRTASPTLSKKRKLEKLKEIPSLADISSKDTQFLSPNLSKKKEKIEVKRSLTCNYLPYSLKSSNTMKSLSLEVSVQEQKEAKSMRKRLENQICIRLRSDELKFTILSRRAFNEIIESSKKDNHILKELLVVQKAIFSKDGSFNIHKSRLNISM